MRAVVCDRYGPPEVLRLADIPEPVPRPGEVLVRVHATTVNRSDTETRLNHPAYGRLFRGMRRPRWRILGTEFAGVVEQAGPGVTGFKRGDEVFGINAWRFGTHAELVRVRANAAIAPKPATLDFADAAAVCDGGLLALGCLRAAGLRPGQHILIYGASGSIGTAAVQLARHLGADVTAVCGAKNVELVRSLGAEHVVDYLREDFTASGLSYDHIFDAVGKLSFGRCRGSLVAGGSYLATDGFGHLVRSFLPRRAGGRRVVFPIPPKFTRQDVEFLRQLTETGEYRPVVDRRYRLEEVIEASRYVESGQKTGNVVLIVTGA